MMLCFLYDAVALTGPDIYDKNMNKRFTVFTIRERKKERNEVNGFDFILGCSKSKRYYSHEESETGIV